MFPKTRGDEQCVPFTRTRNFTIGSAGRGRGYQFPANGLRSSFRGRSKAVQLAAARLGRPEEGVAETSLSPRVSVFGNSLCKVETDPPPAYNPADMNLVQQTFESALNSKQTRLLGTHFASSDDDFSLRVSIYLGSTDGRGEILKDVTQVLRAYGFTNFTRINQAPGSFFLSINVRFGTNDRQAAHKSKQQLQKDLLSDVLPQRPPQKRSAVRKLKKSVWSRTEKGLLTIIVAGASFLGNLTGDVFKDEIKEGIESWLKDNGPKIVQKVDSVVAKELPAGVANSFHNAVKNYIDNSPEKTELKPPTSK
jgi:hypothetical protein